MSRSSKGRGRQGARRSAAEARPSGRNLKVKVRTAKGRKISSTRWLQRQLNDPYVADAQARGYRSRAAFKLLQLDEKFGFLQNARRIVDLGCAPGGWLQVSLERAGQGCVIVGIDLQEVVPLAGVTLIEGDFLSEEALPQLIEALGGKADVVLSDMAASSTGHPKTDHLRVMGLVEAAAEFAEEVLAPGGAFVAKVLQGGTEHDLLHNLKRRFTKVRHVKPAASRSDSAEMYLVATGFHKEGSGED